MKRTAARFRNGFTIIELLIVILILAILMAVALPLYLGTLSSSERSACRTNMETIAHAEQSYRARHSPYAYTTDLSQLNSDLVSTPTCPAGGTYSVRISNGSDTAQNGNPVGAGGLIVECSDSGHGIYAPGVDTE